MVFIDKLNGVFFSSVDSLEETEAEPVEQVIASSASQSKSTLPNTVFPSAQVVST